MFSLLYLGVFHTAASFTCISDSANGFRCIEPVHWTMNFVRKQQFQSLVYLLVYTFAWRNERRATCDINLLESARITFQGIHVSTGAGTTTDFRGQDETGLKQLRHLYGLASKRRTERRRPRKRHGGFCFRA